MYLLFPHNIIWNILSQLFPRRFIEATLKLGNIQLCVHGEEQCVYLLGRGGWGE